LKTFLNLPTRPINSEVLDAYPNAFSVGNSGEKIEKIKYKTIVRPIRDHMVWNNPNNSIISKIGRPTV
jgi:hypothetical protein